MLDRFVSSCCSHEYQTNDYRNNCNSLLLLTVWNPSITFSGILYQKLLSHVNVCRFIFLAEYFGKLFSLFTLLPSAFGKYRKHENYGNTINKDNQENCATGVNSEVLLRRSYGWREILGEEFFLNVITIDENADKVLFSNLYYICQLISPKTNIKLRIYDCYSLVYTGKPEVHFLSSIAKPR